MVEQPELVAYVNGRIVPLSEAAAAMKEGGIQSSGGFYDHERTFQGQVFRLAEHLTRLYNGLEHTGIDPSLTLEEMQAITLDLIEANTPRLAPDQEFLVTQIVSVTPQSADGKPPMNVLIYCQFLDLASFAQDYVAGVRVVTPSTYALPAQPERSGRRRPKVFPLMMDAEGNISECRGGNFMFVQDGRIKLPNRRNVLPGVSMATVLEIAASAGIAVDEDDYSTYDVYISDEAFVSSTRFCMVPVADVNGFGVGCGVPGTITRAILDGWVELVGTDFVRQALSQLHRPQAT